MEISIVLHSEKFPLKNPFENAFLTKFWRQNENSTKFKWVNDLKACKKVILKCIEIDDFLNKPEKTGFAFGGTIFIPLLKFSWCSSKCAVEYLTCLKRGVRTILWTGIISKTNAVFPAIFLSKFYRFKIWQIMTKYGKNTAEYG